jgi:hypothetical protein
MKHVISSIVALAAMTTVASGAELTKATIAAWDRYVRSTEARRTQETPDALRFLASDFGTDAAAVRRALMRGEMVIQEVPLGPAERAALPDGTLHHWRGAVLVRNVTLNALIEALRNPQQHGYAPPDVLEWRVLERQNGRERVFLQLRRREIVTAIFNTEHEVEFTRHGSIRASSRSVSTRIAEVTDAGGAPAERPVGQDRGFLWRMNSYWRYESVQGGVLVELESLSLSRNVPTVLKPLARPIITRVARESIEQTLGSIRDQLGRPSAGASALSSVIQSADMRSGRDDSTGRDRVPRPKAPPASGAFAVFGRTTRVTCTPTSNA